MSKGRIDPKTQNVDLGICITESGVLPAKDQDLLKLATVIKATVAGTITYYNKYNKKTGSWAFEAGESYMIAFTQINSVGTTLAANEIYWGVTDSDIGGDEYAS
jgi:hypothetical protein